MLVVSRKKYDEFCAKNSSKIPFFCQPWWLDALSENNKWLPLLVTTISGEMIGVCPLLKKQKLGFSYLTMPAFSAKTGIYTIDNNKIPSHFLALLFNTYKKNIYIITKDFTKNSTKEQWTKNGFGLEENWVYVITNKLTYEEQSCRFRKVTQQLIKKGKHTCYVEIGQNMDSYLKFYQKNSYETDKEKEQALPILKKAMEAAVKQKIGFIYTACLKETSEIGAAAFFIQDTERLYYVSAVMNRRLERSNASRVLLATAIQYALQNNRTFDFCGGNIPSIGDFFASFGAEKEYFFKLRYDRFPSLINLFDSIFKFIKRK